MGNVGQTGEGGRARMKPRSTGRRVRNSGLRDKAKKSR